MCLSRFFLCVVIYKSSQPLLCLLLLSEKWWSMHLRKSQKMTCHTRRWVRCVLIQGHTQNHSAKPHYTYYYILAVFVCHTGWKDHLWILLGPRIYWSADRVSLSGGSERKGQLQPSTFSPLQGAVVILNRSDRPYTKKWCSIMTLAKAESNSTVLHFLSSTFVIHFSPSCSGLLVSNKTLLSFFLPFFLVKIHTHKLTCSCLIGRGSFVTMVTHSCHYYGLTWSSLPVTPMRAPSAVCVRLLQG